MIRIFNIKNINSIKSCALTDKAAFQFSVFTNETLKKEFEEKLKEKYMGKHSEKESELNDKDSLFGQMREAYEQVIEELDEEGNNNL